MYNLNIMVELDKLLDKINSLPSVEKEETLLHIQVIINDIVREL
jgi:hypothetical protein